MTILDTDVGFWHAHTNVDTDNAGGMQIAARVIDGAVGDVFGPVPSLVREATGYVSPRLIYAGVSTPDTPIYYRSIVFISQPPTDPLINIALIKAGAWGENWLAARQRFEQYMIRGIRGEWLLLEMQPQGTRTLNLYAKTDAELPGVGRVYTLVAHEGLDNEYAQYVIVQSVSATVRTLTILVNGNPVDVVRNVITVGLLNTLDYNFDGGDLTTLSYAAVPAVIHETTVADAAQFMGIAALSHDVASGDMTVLITNPYMPIAPSSQAQVALTPYNPIGQATALYPSGNGLLTVALPLAFGPGLTFYLPCPITPGSLRYYTSSITYTDNGTGNLIAGTTPVATIDYANHAVTGLNACPAFTSASGAQAQYNPAAAPTSHVYTRALPINSVTRGLAYQLAIDPPPMAGSMKIEYRAANKKYTLYDNGAGLLSGSSTAYGIGRYSWITNVLTLTLVVPPDINTEIVISWAVATLYFNRSSVSILPVKWRLTGAHQGWVPGTVTITWPKPTSGNYTATDANSPGTLTGDATGKLYYAGGYLDIWLNNLPLAGTQFTLVYEYGSPKSKAFASPTRETDGTLHLDLVDANVQPHSVEVEWTVQLATPGTTGATIDVAYAHVTLQRTLATSAATYNSNKLVHDDGSGGFTDGVSGSINYTGATLVLMPDFDVTIPVAKTDNTTLTVSGSTYNGSVVYQNTGWTYQSTLAVLATGTPVVVRYRTSDTDTTATEYISVANPELDLTTYYAEQIIQGAVVFSIGGKTYFDRGGQLYTDFNSSNGTGTAAATINYATGVAQLSVWGTGANTPVLNSLATQLGEVLVSEAIFYAQSAPLQPGSVGLTAVMQDGGDVNYTFDPSGSFTATHIEGTCNFAYGLFHVQFGDWVVHTGTETDGTLYSALPWYNADNIRSDGKIWRPVFIYANSAQLTGVAYTYIPTSVERIGVDTTRLPPGCEVAMVRIGDIVAIHRTASATVATTPAGGATLDLGDVSVARVTVTDAAGVSVPASATTWAVNKPSGILTWSTTLNLSAYTFPLTVKTVVMDRRTVADVDINGTLTLSLPLLHAFPATTSYLSSAIELGDLQAQVDEAHMYTQATWSASTPVWSDARVGSEPAFQFDNINYRVGVSNDGTITQRWVCYFVTTTTYFVFGEDLGQLNTVEHSISADFTFINPASITEANPSGASYFTIPAGALSTGQPGNAFRFNTQAARYPLWVTRCVLPGTATTVQDDFELTIVGDTE